MFCLHLCQPLEGPDTTEQYPRQYGQRKDRLPGSKKLCCHEIIVYFVYQNNTNKTGPNQLCTAVHCIWSVLESALFQNHCCHEIWVLNPLGSQELDKHSLHRDTLPPLSVSSPCLPQEWIAPMVWLWCRVLPYSALLIWEHRGLFGTSRQPAQPSLALSELPWFHS